jgi:hypothetical protein
VVSSCLKRVCMSHDFGSTFGWVLVLDGVSGLGFFLTEIRDFGADDYTHIHTYRGKKREKKVRKRDTHTYIIMHTAPLYIHDIPASQNAVNSTLLPTHLWLKFTHQLMCISEPYCCTTKCTNSDNCPFSPRWKHIHYRACWSFA